VGNPEILSAISAKVFTCARKRAVRSIFKCNTPREDFEKAAISLYDGSRKMWKNSDKSLVIRIKISTSPTELLKTEPVSVKEFRSVGKTAKAIFISSVFGYMNTYLPIKVIYKLSTGNRERIYDSFRAIYNSTELWYSS